MNQHINSIIDNLTSDGLKFVGGLMVVKLIKVCAFKKADKQPTIKNEEELGFNVTTPNIFFEELTKHRQLIESSRW